MVVVVGYGRGMKAGLCGLLGPLSSSEEMISGSDGMMIGSFSSSEEMISGSDGMKIGSSSSDMRSIVSSRSESSISMVRSSGGAGTWSSISTLLSRLSRLSFSSTFLALRSKQTSFL